MSDAWNCLLCPARFSQWPTQAVEIGKRGVWTRNVLIDGLLHVLRRQHATTAHFGRPAKPTPGISVPPKALSVSPEEVAKRSEKPSPVAVEPKTFEALFAPEPEPEPKPVIPEMIWPVCPEGFEEGVVQDVDVKRGFILILWRGGRILAHASSVIAPAAHLCYFRNAPVIFRLYHDPEKDRDVAADCNLNIVTNPPNEVEVSTVIEDHNTWYVLERECGCRIILPGKLLGGSASLVIGTKIRHRHIEESDGRIAASSAEIIAA